MSEFQELSFSIEPDIIAGRYIRRSKNGEIESASATEWDLYSRLLSLEGKDMGYVVSDHSKEVAALKARIAELEKQLGIEPKEESDAAEKADTEDEEPEPEAKPARRSRK